MVTVPESPAELGLPFDRWRPNQHDAMLRTAASTAKSVILEASTGFGKTAIAAATPMIHRASAVILTHTHTLQDQYAHTYLGIASVRGRNNFPDWQAYADQRDRGMAAQVMVTNYPWFLYSANRGTPPQHIDWLICDEAQDIEEALGNFLEMRIDRRTYQHLGIDLPQGVGPMPYEWYAQAILPKLRKAIEHCGAADQPDPAVRDLSRQLRDAEWALALMAEGLIEWIIENHGHDLVLKPIWPGKFATKLLFRHSQRHLLMSASILDHDAFASSLAMESWESITVPETIHPSRRPVIYRPTAPMGHRRRSPDSAGLQACVNAVDRIIGEHQGERGIIHTVNYQIAQYLVKNSTFRQRFITHGDAATRVAALERFRATLGAVLVSPSMDIGVDLPYDQARWQIIAKIPFPNLNDPVVDRRRQFEPEWYARRTLSRLLQTCGRIVRAEDDYGVTYILDADLMVLQSHLHLLPGWFREALQGV